MSEFFKPHRDPNPSCKLPDDLDTPVWRYMDMAKFHSLLKEKALYLCRADRLQDRFEGTYSHHQISEMEDWFKEIGDTHMIDRERKRRERDRRKSYISCWCKYKYDLDLIWKAYIRNPPGIAIMSSVRKLQQACDTAVGFWPLDISEVAYFDQDKGENINYCGTPTVFLHKDHHFQLDNEVRIVHYPNISEPTPEHVFLPVSLSALIERVVLQPKASEDDLKSVCELLNNAGLVNLPVMASRDDRELIK